MFIMKLSDMLDPNPMNTSDKRVVKNILVKETHKSDLEPKGQGHRKKGEDNKPRKQKYSNSNLSKDSLSN